MQIWFLSWLLWLNRPFVLVTGDIHRGPSQSHALTHLVIHCAINTKNQLVLLFSLCFPRQCGLRRCPGQKCRHQEAEQTLPEPDPRQEGVPGVGAHEMCQSQKCKRFTWGNGEIAKTKGKGKECLLSEWSTLFICTLVAVYFWFSLEKSLCYTAETSNWNIVTVLNSMPAGMHQTGKTVKQRALLGIRVLLYQCVLCPPHVPAHFRMLHLSLSSVLHQGHSQLVSTVSFHVCSV